MSAEGQAIQGNSGRLPRILVVDDDQDVRTLLCSSLEQLGFEVIEALSDGSEAVEFISSNKDKVDLILLDLVMRRLHGNVALPILKSRKPDVKVIIISAFFMNYNTHFLTNLGADGFLEKPFTLEELRSAIHNLFPLERTNNS